jgi:hypothetical protein
MLQNICHVINHNSHVVPNARIAERLELRLGVVEMPKQTRISLERNKADRGGIGVWKDQLDIGILVFKTGRKIQSVELVMVQPQLLKALS